MYKNSLYYLNKNVNLHPPKQISGYATGVLQILALVYFGGPKNYFPKFWWLFEQVIWHAPYKM